MNDSTLQMTGIFVDTVTKVGPWLFSPTGDESKGLIDEMHQLWKNYDSCKAFLTSSEITGSVYAYAKDQSLLDAFHHSIVTGYSVALAPWISSARKLSQLTSYQFSSQARQAL